MLVAENLCPHRLFVKRESRFRGEWAPGWGSGGRGTDLGYELVRHHAALISQKVEFCLKPSETA